MTDSRDITRRDVVKIAGAATAVVAARKLQGAPGIRTVHAAEDVVNLGVIGTGGRGTYHVRHINGLEGGRCAALCDIDPDRLQNAITESNDDPEGYADHRELLARQDIDGVLIAVPVYAHFPITRDALLAGKHVFCEKSLVFTAEEVHQLREIAESRPNLILQTGLQRRCSRFYQAAKQMVDEGMIGNVTHVRGMWHRKGPLSAAWTPPSWRVFRKTSGGLTAELGSHQMDVASWMFGVEPEFVVGVGGLDVYKDGRDIYDNIQLIYSYPNGRKHIYSSILTNNHLPLFRGQARTEFGEMIMGTDGTIHITVGGDTQPVLGMWFSEPSQETLEKVEEAAEEPGQVAAATLYATDGAAPAWPIMFDEEMVQESDSFLSKELKYAKMWLYRKGVVVPEEANPVDTQLMEFFNSVRTGTRPRADLEVGLNDSSCVILSNLAMDEGRRVYFNEMETMGRGEAAESEA